MRISVSVHFCTILLYCKCAAFYCKISTTFYSIDMGNFFFLREISITVDLDLNLEI